MTTYKPDQRLKNLVSAFQQLSSEDDYVAFLRDLLTEPEISEFTGRFAVAQGLASGKSQRTVSLEAGVSIATVTRVNQWLLRGMNGYKTVIDRLNQQHHRKAD
ncbi:DNA-binding transcriptional regulator [Candidatus Dojkabacteria bacterium CG_4_10_14_3_um_filter_Dojkabacteria_WS6_41_9]|nr:MAG: DNA-binding transcriptional regulator [Candidatus Dojkabacteria bacterium CG_4_10_14_3_um_filter_Dojkabacteria_WS6_41_9]